jgi:3-oxoacyl-[acyl-carrier protein] reductase
LLKSLRDVVRRFADHLGRWLLPHTNLKHQVVITYTSSSSAQGVDALISSLPLGSAVKIQADLRNSASPQIIVDATITAFGPRIDILVNNAGINKPTPLDTLTIDDFSDMFDTNVRAVVLMTQAALPHFRASDARIINIGSTAARVGVPKISLYTSSKLAVEALTRSWASELGDRGITVNTVAPGSTQSDLLSASAEADDVKEEAAQTPVERRVGTPNDVAQVVAWLASEESRWVSGQCICASGGYRMY